jgi:hypothetical protein
MRLLVFLQSASSRQYQHWGAVVVQTFLAVLLLSLAW